LSDAAPNPPSQSKPRGWSLVAAGLLLLALALVVLYTSKQAFSSPLALVVVAAIGLAALLLQLRLRKDRTSGVHAPLWLNVIALILAIAAFFGDIFHFTPTMVLITALGAVICFAASGIVVLHALRKIRT
jgi:FtsH-binding integral membrane protein